MLCGRPSSDRTASFLTPKSSISGACSENGLTSSELYVSSPELTTDLQTKHEMLTFGEENALFNLNICPVNLGWKKPEVLKEVKEDQVNENSQKISNEDTSKSPEKTKPQESQKNKNSDIKRKAQCCF